MINTGESELEVSSILVLSFSHLVHTFTSRFFSDLARYVKFDI